MLKTSTSLNTFKHNIKTHYFNELKKRVLVAVFLVLLMFQSKYIPLNLIICMYYFKKFSSLLFLENLISFFEGPQ